MLVDDFRDVMEKKLNQKQQYIQLKFNTAKV